MIDSHKREKLSETFGEYCQFGFLGVSQTKKDTDIYRARVPVKETWLVSEDSEITRENFGTFCLARREIK